jgi:hypothetical protein
MAARPSIALVLVGALSSLGAGYRTQNFAVEAPTPELAQQAGQYAEYYRREKALQWLGREMPAWNEPCPLKISVTMNGSGGATSFVFDRGAILSQDMHIEGTVERLMHSVLPHEITHTVFAYYYRQPVPRWADEGGSVLSEDDLERSRHDRLVREILNSPGRMIPLRRLFTLSQYPRDVMVLYAEGYSVTNYLVGISSRPAFLQFIAQGMRGDWDAAVRAHLRFASIEELESAWLTSLRSPKSPPANVLASRDALAVHGGGPAVAARQTLPPAQPLLEAPRPVYRGLMPAAEGEGAYSTTAAVRPGYLPDCPPQGGMYAPVSAAPPAATPPPAPRVQLGVPQFDVAPAAPVPAPQPPASQLGQPVVPGHGSPVGWSR